MPIIHCSRPCKNNQNSEDKCELPADARVYIDCCCSGFRKRPLPEPPPMIDRLDTFDTGKPWNGRRRRLIR